MSVRDAAASALRVVWLRARAPRWLDGSSLPELLDVIGGKPVVARAASVADVTRGIRLAEALVGRARALPDTCLFRALARYGALRRAGLPARFVLGVRAGHAAPEGHAWIELDGAPFQEVLDPALVRQWSHPPSR